MQVLIRESSKPLDAQTQVQKDCLSYSSVLAQACTKHVFAGRTLTPGAAAAMRVALKQCSSAVLRIHGMGRMYLGGVTANLALNFISCVTLWEAIISFCCIVKQIHHIVNSRGSVANSHAD